MESSAVQDPAAGEVLTAPLTLDCTTCGACCVFFGRHAIAVFPGDHPPQDRVEVDDLGFRYMAVIENTTRCTCLYGTVGIRVTCSIYKDRPRPCSEFTPGNRLCLIARRLVIGGNAP